MNNILDTYDVVIIGASFAGLTLAHHLDPSLKVLIVERKAYPGASVESTGLITSATRDEFLTFFDVDTYITNPVTTICVVAPDFRDYFCSHTQGAWIYQTDTKALVKALHTSLPTTTEVRSLTSFMGYDDTTGMVILKSGSQNFHIKTRILIGADGGESSVAKVTGLEQNTRFLFGYEKVIKGKILLGEKPEATIYHFWFGDFSLGYGGWLSPTEIDGVSGFRIGLAKLKEEKKGIEQLFQLFIDRLVQEKILEITDEKVEYTFGSHIPIGGVLSRIQNEACILIGDAAGYCGAFAADGIKGSLISAKETAKMLNAHFLHGEEIGSLSKSMRGHPSNILRYFRKQVFYRFVWDLMRTSRSFFAMFRIIQAESEGFITQFCDSKDKGKSLIWTVLKRKHVLRLVIYSWSIFLDQAGRIFKQ